MSLKKFVKNELNWIKNFIIVKSNLNDIRCTLPKSTRFSHYGLGIVISKNVKFGENCYLRQNVTLGQRNGICDITIGNNVIFGANSCVLGRVNIGNNAKIGANAIILKDVPNNKVITGIWK